MYLLAPLRYTTHWTVPECPTKQTGTNIKCGTHNPLYESASIQSPELTVMSSPKNLTPLALPAPDESSTTDADMTTLEVGGKSISFDKLGPMIVNSDGTLSRIANWQEMTAAEQKNTIRVLSKRNQLRTSTLAQAQTPRGVPGDTTSIPE